MVQTRIEEKMEMFIQELHGIKKEINKLPTIEKTLNVLSKNMETKSNDVAIHEIGDTREIDDE